MKGWKNSVYIKLTIWTIRKQSSQQRFRISSNTDFISFLMNCYSVKISIKIKYWQNVFNIWNCELHNWDIRCKYPNSLSYFPQINHQNISRINEFTNLLTNSSADRNFKMLCKNWRSPQNHQPTSHSDRQQPKIRLGSVFSTNLFNKIHFWF